MRRLTRKQVIRDAAWCRLHKTFPHAPWVLIYYVAYYWGRAKLLSSEAGSLLLASLRLELERYGAIVGRWFR